ncbi:MAG: ABC transporter substrate-binding protein [Rhizobiaceae bacterium]|nr:ABC transporter substrate-binding protein [Rhizobiaceae bacterium]
MFSQLSAAAGRAFVRSAAAIAVLGMLSPVAQAVEADAFPDAKRVVAVGGSILEIVYALGEQGRLVARDSTGLYPPEAMSLPDVGYMRALSPEGVLSVNPDAILMLEGSGPPEAVDVIKKAAIPVATVPESFDKAGIVAKIETVGRALGVDAKAAELAAKVDADIAAASAAAAAHETKKRVLFVLSMQGGRLLASGSGTAADGIVALAGAVNAVEGFSGYKQLSDEAVYAAAPDVVLMMDRGGDHGATAAELFAHPALAGTPAGEAKALIRMDGAYLLGFGPRTADAVRDLAASLYGGH